MSTAFIKEEYGNHMQTTWNFVFSSIQDIAKDRIHTLTTTTSSVLDELVSFTKQFEKEIQKLILRKLSMYRWGGLRTI